MNNLGLAPMPLVPPILASALDEWKALIVRRVEAIKLEKD